MAADCCLLHIDGFEGPLTSSTQRTWKKNYRMQEEMVSIEWSDERFCCKVPQIYIRGGC